MFKQTIPFKDRLASFAKDMRAKAKLMPPGPDRNAMLVRARQADTASHLDDWANSPGLQPPKPAEQPAVRDMRASQEKLRSDAVEAALIRDLAVDTNKRELFTRLAAHLSVLASDVEAEMAKLGTQESD